MQCFNYLYYSEPPMAKIEIQEGEENPIVENQQEEPEFVSRYDEQEAKRRKREQEKKNKVEEPHKAPIIVKERSSSPYDRIKTIDPVSLCPSWENNLNYVEYGKNPLFFLKNVFEWISQRIYPLYEDKLIRARKTRDYHKLKLDMFRTMEQNKSVLQISRQQVEMLYHYKNAIQKYWPKTLAFCSWNWVGKTWIAAFIMFHFAICFYGAKVIYIAPKNDMVLETKGFVKTLFNIAYRYAPHVVEKYNTLYYWWDSYNSSIKFVTSKTWFQWIHSQNFLIVADEASDVSDDILRSVNRLLWRWNNIFIMLWNPKTDEWYFHDICCSDSEHIATLHFDAEQSPLIDREYIQKAKDLYWEHSDEYIRRIKWWFPRMKQEKEKSIF